MDDLISRQATIDAIWKIRRQQQMLGDTHKADLVMHGIYLTENAMEQLPTVQPERKKGEWIEKSIVNNSDIEEWQSAKCSVCGKYHTTPYLYNFDNFNYCPMCGADMRGEEQ